MINIADYYKKEKPTIANSKEFDLSMESESCFPELIHIGEIESLTGHNAPALISLQKANGLCFLTKPENRDLVHRTMQEIALRLLLSLPTGLCKFTLFDSTGLGANLISLSGLNSKIKGENILTDVEELKRSLNATKTDIPNIIQKVLGQRYLGKSLIDYNKDAGELAKPYHFYFITDFPNGLSQDICDSIEKILKIGKQAGVYVIMSIDTTYIPSNFSHTDPKRLLDFATTIFESDGRYHIKNYPEEELFHDWLRLKLIDNLPTVDDIEAIQDATDNALKSAKKVSVNISDKLTLRNLWMSDSSYGIEVPIGKVNATDIQNFVLSIEDGVTDNPHHCLIGGATGSGKTVLLHNIICTTAWFYSPEEVQFVLLDYKEGTEFKIYETLPHVKVLSIQSEREYGVSVFKFLNKEIERRGELFKNHNVSNIGKYNSKSGQKLPRLLVIIDEFQVLLNGSHSIAQFISDALEDIGRRGRSFGINLILSTQSLSGVSINNALSHIGLRITLKLNTAKDCDALLGMMNHIPFTTLSKKGEAVYNARGGLTEGNVRFQTAYLSDSKINNLINSIGEEVLKRYGTLFPFKRYIYDGNMAADISTNTELYNNNFRINDKTCTVYLGEPVALVEENTFYTLRKQNESNVLIVGKDLHAAVSIMYHSLNQIIPQSSSNSSFYIFNKINVDNELFNSFDSLKNKFKNLKVISNDLEIENIILNLYSELEERMNGKEQSSRIVLVFADIYNIRFLRKSGYTISETCKKNLDLIKNGPEFGIHCIVYASSYNYFSAVLDPTQYKSLNEFEVKVELKGDDGYKIYSDLSGEASRMSPTRSNIANIRTPQLDEIQKFKVYSL